MCLLFTTRHSRNIPCLSLSTSFWQLDSTESGKGQPYRPRLGLGLTAAKSGDALGRAKREAKTPIPRPDPCFGCSRLDPVPPSPNCRHVGHLRDEIVPAAAVSQHTQRGGSSVNACHHRLAQSTPARAPSRTIRNAACTTKSVMMDVTSSELSYAGAGTRSPHAARHLAASCRLICVV